MSAAALLLAATASTIPFLVSYQEVQVLGKDNTQVGELFVVDYVQAYEDGLPSEEQPALRDLLVRVDSQYADGDRRARLGMSRQYLTIADPARFGGCSEAILMTGHGDGVRYRQCISGRNGAGPAAVALVEDLTTPERIFIISHTTRGGRAAVQLLDQIFQRYEKRLGSAQRAQDSGKAAKLAEAFKGEVAQLKEEVAAFGNPVSVAEVEVNGVWDTASLRPGETVAGLLGSLWRQADVTPGFADRFSLLLRTVYVLSTESPALASSVGMLRPLSDPEEGVETVPGAPWAAWRDRELRLARGAHARSLGEFLPCPDELVRKYYPRRKWDPPQLGLTFDERVKRMDHGKGW